MHLDRPPDAPASIALISAAPGRSIRNPQGLKARHRSGHRSPLPRAMTFATRPLVERDGGDDNGPIAECKNKIGTFANYFF
jgi:hypothetical protein